MSEMRVQVSPWVPKLFTGYRRFRFDWLLLPMARVIPRLRLWLRRRYGEYTDEVYICGDTIICSYAAYERVKKAVENV
jgi:hypothetical protein